VGLRARTTDPKPITKYVQMIETSNLGEIRVTVSAGINTELSGRFVYLKPWADTLRALPPSAGSAIAIWDCGGDGGAPNMDKYLPGSCRAPQAVGVGAFSESTS